MGKRLLSESVLKTALTSTAPGRHDGIQQSRPEQYSIFNQLRKRTWQGRVGHIMPSKYDRVITPAQLDAAALTFDLLSVPGRLHLVWLLATQELDVTTLAQATGATIPAASQQLAKLRAAGVVTARRDGRRQLYRVDDPHIISVIDEMFRHIQPDGTLAPDPNRPRPPRRPRFAGSAMLK